MASLAGMRSALAWMALLALGSFGSTASAQGSTERARAAYAEGESRSRSRDYPAAARAFAEADALAPNDTALEAALEAALLADDPALGMTLVTRSDRSPESARIGAVARARSAFEARAGKVSIRCLAETPACVAAIDERPAVDVPTWVGVGAHRVSMRKGDRSVVENVSVAARSSVEVAFPAPQASPAQTTPAPASPLPPDATGGEEGSGLSPWWFVAGCGVTVALGAVTVVHGVAASGAHDDFDEANGSADRATLEQLAADGQSLDTRTNVFLVATAVAGAGTAALGLFAIDWSGGGGARASLSPGPDGVRLGASGSF